MWNIKKKAAGESDKPPAQQEPTKPTKELYASLLRLFSMKNNYKNQTRNHGKSKTQKKIRIWKLQVLAGFATVCAALQVAGDVTGLIEPF